MNETAPETVNEYALFDVHVFTAVRLKYNTLRTITKHLEICSIAYLKAQQIENGTPYTRTIDKSLQRLRQAGRISYTREGGWTVKQGSYIMTFAETVITGDILDRLEQLMIGIVPSDAWYTIHDKIADFFTNEVIARCSGNNSVRIADFVMVARNMMPALIKAVRERNVLWGEVERLERELAETRAAQTKES